MSKVREAVLIMKGLSQAVAELFKCQIDQVRHAFQETLTKLLIWVIIILTAIMLAIGGLAMIIWATYILLITVIGPAAAGYILGLFLIMLALIVILLVRNMPNMTAL